MPLKYFRIINRPIHFIASFNNNLNKTVIKYEINCYGLSHNNNTIQLTYQLYPHQSNILFKNGTLLSVSQPIVITNSTFRFVDSIQYVCQGQNCTNTEITIVVVAGMLDGSELETNFLVLFT